jgi:DNA primase
VTPGRLQAILQTIGARNTSIARDRVRCSCLLAQWTHPGGKDSTPSMVVFPEGRHGDPIYSCQACHRKGSLRNLVCFLWHKTGLNMMNVIEALDGPDAPVKAPEGKEVKNPFLREKANRVAKLVRDGGAHEVYRRKRQTEDAPWHDKYAIAASDDVPEIPWAEYEPHLTETIHPYAEARGIHLDTWLEWELGVDTRMRRILFPMRDHHGRLIAISGRLYEEKKCLRCGGDIITLAPVPPAVKGKQICGNCGKKPPPKYLHSTGFKRNVFLYGEHLLPNDSGTKLYVVEGHLDALAMWQDGYRPVVATLGTNVGESQIERLVHYASLPKRPMRIILVVHDGDEAGRLMGVMVKRMIAGRVPVFARPCPDGSDPAKMLPYERVKLLGEPWKRGVDTQLAMG